MEDLVNYDLRSGDPTYFHIGGHGTPTAMYDDRKADEKETGPRISAKEVADIMRKEGWNGEAVVIHGCDTGQYNGLNYPFAQQLADELQVDVIAPTQDIIYTNREGVPPKIEFDGHWNKFSPGESSPTPMQPEWSPY
ncbi:MAG: hypothetical protein AAGA96_06755 [Verrucomicrobiota bacterium]